MIIVFIVDKLAPSQHILVAIQLLMESLTIMIVNDFKNDYVLQSYLTVFEI